MGLLAQNPSKSRKICILERKNLQRPSNKTALENMPPSAHLRPWVKRAAETKPLVFGNNSKRPGDVNEDSIFRAPRESARVHYWEPGKRFWWGGRSQCRSTYHPACGLTWPRPTAGTWWDSTCRNGVASPTEAWGLRREQFCFVDPLGERGNKVFFPPLNCPRKFYFL